jgi:tetratricopeptide (TPR) repeat protein
MPGSFKTNIDALFDELSLAFQWNRPSLLLTVHKSQIGEKKARESLARKLKSAGRPVVEISIEEARPDASSRILAQENPAGCVFFVSGLDRGGGPDGKDAYRALNLAREVYVENQLKVVFWLTSNEATNITKMAPDFWAFRHRVIEFASPAPHLSGDRLTALLAWHGSEMPSMPGELSEKIGSEEQMLKELPNTPDSLAMRIEACYLLGHAHWAAGNTEQALKALMAGTGLAQDREFAQMSTWLLNGIAIIRHERGRYQDVLDILQDLVSHDPDDGILGMNLAVALCSVGKNHEGITQAARAAGRKNADPRFLVTLGHLHLALGKLDEAVSFFERAAALMPNLAGSHEALAACYFKMDLADEAASEIEQARQHAHAAYDRHAIIEQAIQGNSQGALRLLSAALAAGLVSKTAIRHDAILNLFIDPAQLDAIL